MTPSGIEPATFRFVAQILTTVPPRSPTQFNKKVIKNDKEGEHGKKI
jgi:hypothetical protein